MDIGVPIQTAKNSRTLRVTWLLMSALALYPIVTLWLVPRVRWMAGEFESLTEPGTTAWLIAFAVGGIGCVVLLVGVILAFQNRKVAFNARLWTALAVTGTLLLWGYWFYATSTRSVSAAAAPSGHSVKLTWKPSTTPGVNYNVYRSRSQDSFPDPPLNPSPISENTFVDTTVQSGTTYYYAARAVDTQGHQSGNSNIARADVP